MPYKNETSTHISKEEQPDPQEMTRQEVGYLVTHKSDKTGSSWLIDFNAQGQVMSARLMTKDGRITKVKLSNKKNWLVWLAYGQI